MPYDSNGVYTLPIAPFTNGTVAQAPDVNTTLSDIAAALTRSAATTRSQYPLVGQIQDGGLTWAGVSGGTATAITAATTPALADYATGQRIAFRVGTSCGDNPTLSVSGLAVKKLYIPTLAGAAQMQTGDLVAGDVASVIYDAALDGGTGGFIADVPTLGWTPISRVTTTGSQSTVDITLPAGFAQFRLTAYQVLLSSSAQVLARTSTNNGSSYDSGASDYGRAYSFQAATLNAGQSAGASIFVTDANAANSVITFNGILHPGAASASGARLYGQSAGLNTAATEYYSGHFSGGRNATGRITNIRFLLSAGNFVNGSVIVLEGLR